MVNLLHGSPDEEILSDVSSGGEGTKGLYMLDTIGREVCLHAKAQNA